MNILVRENANEISCAMGTPLIIDATTQKRTFGHYARVLVDIEFSHHLFIRSWWKGKALRSLSRWLTNDSLTSARIVRFLVIRSRIVVGCIHKRI